MGITSDPAPELEEERQRLVEKMAAEHGVGWSGPFRPGSFGCHELLDRTSLLADSLERFVLEHPSCIQNPEWFALAKDVVDSLRDLYQRIGREHV